MEWCEQEQNLPVPVKAGEGQLFQDQGQALVWGPHTQECGSARWFCLWEAAPKAPTRCQCGSERQCEAGAALSLQTGAGALKLCALGTLSLTLNFISVLYLTEKVPKMVLSSRLYLS